MYFPGVGNPSKEGNHLLLEGIFIELTTIEKGAEIENGRVASPVSVSIHSINFSNGHFLL